MNHKPFECPKCGAELDVEKTIKEQILGQKQDWFNEQQAVLDKDRNELDMEQRKRDKLYEERLAKGIEEVKDEIRSELLREHSGADKVRQKELAEKSEKIQELNQVEAENQKLIRKMNEMKSEGDAATERQIKSALEVHVEELQAKHELERRDWQKQKEDGIRNALATKGGLEQGSVKNQGTVQEESIKDWLDCSCPYDTIEEIKPGAPGGDVLQMVYTGRGQYCGSIYYESKRTKSFDDKWVVKLKRDMQEKNATIGIIVTQSMPVAMDIAGVYKGVWVCRLHEYQLLSQALRQGLMKLNYLAITNVNKGQKMEYMYDYMVSGEFSRLFQSIVESMYELRDETDRLNRLVQKTAGTQKKIVEQVIASAIAVFAQVKGIAGDAVPSVPLLELPESDLSLCSESVNELPVAITDDCGF